MCWRGFSIINKVFSILRLLHRPWSRLTGPGSKIKRRMPRDCVDVGDGIKLWWWFPVSRLRMSVGKMALFHWGFLSCDILYWYHKKSKSSTAWTQAWSLGSKFACSITECCMPTERGFKYVNMFPSAFVMFVSRLNLSAYQKDFFHWHWSRWNIDSVDP